MHSGRSLVVGLIAGGALLLSGCPTPFGYYAAGNALTSAVASSTGTDATPVATPLFLSAPVSGGAAVIVSGSPSESSDQYLSLQSETGASIYYTLDGSVPDPNKPATRLYNSSQPIGVLGNGTAVTVNAIAFKALMLPSAMATVVMTISYTQVSSPAFSLPGGSYGSAQSVQITESTGGATLWYTTDGSAPVAGGGSTISGVAPITVAVGGTMTIRAIATAPGYSTSNEASATYTLQPASPSISLPTGTYIGGNAVTISAATPGSVVWYTTDGSMPVAGVSAGGVASVSLTFWRDTTITAITSLTGWSDSPAAVETYTTGLQLYYPFNDPGSASTADVSGWGWNGTVVGTVSAWPDRNANYLSYYLDGSTSMVTQSAFNFANTSTVTVTAWVYCTTSPSLSYFVRTNSGGIGLWQSGTSVGLAICTPNTASASGAVALNGWHFVAGTYDGTLISFYVDGTLAGTTTHPSPGPIGSTAGLTIGYFTNYWAGAIDDLRIYNRVLSSSELAGVMAATY